MSRNTILVLGAICWTGVAVDVLIHLIAGDVVAPAAMGIALVFWMVLRLHRDSTVPEAA
jgi:hypothetical protein